MADDDHEEWKSLMQGLSASFRTLEDGASKMSSALGAADRVIEQISGGNVTSDVVKGIAFGLSLLESVLWIRSVPAHIMKLREHLSMLDAMVAADSLPASAHSWRHQFKTRVDAFEEEILVLDRRMISVKEALRRLSTSQSLSE